MMCAAQMGKTDGFLDIIGSKTDQTPVPILYAGPSKDFVSQQFEPRLKNLLEECRSLRAKVFTRRQTQTRKMVAGVPIRLAHAGSSTALKSDPAAMGLVDEYDEMLANIRGQGDPLGLIEARGDTYADFSTAIASTPSRGAVETETDPVSGLEFWKTAKLDELESAIWRLWQEGTRYHWAWRCPHEQCRTWFIPRWRLLWFKRHSTPAQAKKDAHLVCPSCGGSIHEHHKPALNEGGVFVAPGQWIAEDGTVQGDLADNSTISFWVSGLCSPFRTFGDRAESYVRALNSGEEDKIQTAINAGFGEVHVAGGGDAPEIGQVQSLVIPYNMGETPPGVLRVTMAVDVQKDRLIYIVRGWGTHETSWLIDYSEILGDTSQTEVWQELGEVICHPIGGQRLSVCLVDSGFRPGDPKTVDTHRVYEFCRGKDRSDPVVLPSKGSLTLPQPAIKAPLEVPLRGSRGATYSQPLLRLSTDHWKSKLYDHLRRDPGDLGAFYLPQDIPETYFSEVVSETRKLNPVTGRPQWFRRYRANHCLDIEAMNFAAAWILGVQRLRSASKPRLVEIPVPAAPGQPPPAPVSAGARLARLNAMSPK